MLFQYLSCKKFLQVLKYFFNIQTHLYDDVIIAFFKKIKSLVQRNYFNNLTLCVKTTFFTKGWFGDGYRQGPAIFYYYHQAGTTVAS